MKNISVHQSKPYPYGGKQNLLRAMLKGNQFLSAKEWAEAIDQTLKNTKRNLKVMVADGHISKRLKDASKLPSRFNPYLYGKPNKIHPKAENVKKT